MGGAAAPSYQDLVEPRRGSTMRKQTTIMAVTDDYLAFVVEQFARITPVTARRMFGGVGLSAGGVFFGVIDNNQVFLRTGPGNMADYEAQGCAAFQPMGPDTKPMSYHELPAGVLEDLAQLRLWMGKALIEAAAAKVPVKKPAKKALSKQGKR